MLSMRTKNTTHRLSPEAREMLRWLAEREHRSQANWIEAIVRKEYAKVNRVKA